MRQLNAIKQNLTVNMSLSAYKRVIFLNLYLNREEQTLFYKYIKAHRSYIGTTETITNTYRNNKSIQIQKQHNSKTHAALQYVSQKRFILIKRN